MESSSPKKPKYRQNPVYDSRNNLFKYGDKEVKVDGILIGEMPYDWQFKAMLLEAGQGTAQELISSVINHYSKTK